MRSSAGPRRRHSHAAPASRSLAFASELWSTAIIRGRFLEPRALLNLSQKRGPLACNGWRRCYQSDRYFQVGTNLELQLAVVPVAAVVLDPRLAVAVVVAAVALLPTRIGYTSTISAW